MVLGRRVLVALGLALVVAGAWLLAASPETTSRHSAWRPGEAVAITQDTGNRTWEWSFRLPNNGQQPLRVETRFMSNISVARGDDEGEWELRTLLKVDGVQEDGYQLGGPATTARGVSGSGLWNRHELRAEWTINPGDESMVKATMRNQPTPVLGRDWQVDYDPMQFEVTTSTRGLDGALAATGAGLLLAGFAAVAVVAVPWRLARP